MRAHAGAELVPGAVPVPDPPLPVPVPRGEVPEPEPPGPVPRGASEPALASVGPELPPRPPLHAAPMQTRSANGPVRILNMSEPHVDVDTVPQLEQPGLALALHRIPEGAVHDPILDLEVSRHFGRGM